MTSRTRKLTVGVTMVVIALTLMAVVLFSGPDPGTPIKVTFVGYDEGMDGAVLQLENISDFKVVFVCSPVPKGRSISRSGSLSPSEVLELTVPGLELEHPSPSPRISTRCWRVPTGIRYGVWRALRLVGFGDLRQGSETSLVLPPPPKPSP